MKVSSASFYDSKIISLVLIIQKYHLIFFLILSVCFDLATCSDGLKNQGEVQVDCGGPCEACPGTT